MLLHRNVGAASLSGRATLCSTTIPTTIAGACFGYGLASKFVTKVFPSAVT